MPAAIIMAHSSREVALLRRELTLSGRGLSFWSCRPQDDAPEIRRAAATAVIQPGGSLRDDEVIAAADAAGLAMVFAGMRHFRH